MFDEPEPKYTREQIVKFMELWMKKHNIPKENIVADRVSLRYLFAVRRDIDLT